jgi:hypothetical protein
MDDAVEAERRHQPEAPGEGAREGPERVEAVDPGVHPRRAPQIARQRQRENRDRSAHQHGWGADQQRRQHHVEGEAERGVIDRAQ